MSCRKGKLRGKKIGQRKDEKSDLKLFKENCITLCAIKWGGKPHNNNKISTFIVHVFSLTSVTTMTRIYEPTRKQSTRSQFSKVHIQIYLYIYQLAVAGTWSGAVNSSEARLWRRQSILRGLGCERTSLGTKFKQESHPLLPQEGDTFLWCCHDLYK